MGVRHVLGVLEGGQARARTTVAAAVELADAENANLTFVGVRDSRLFTWASVACCAGAAMHPPVTADPTVAVAQILGLAVELVPRSIPVRTVALGPNTYAAMRGLLRSGDYDAVVASARFLGRARWTMPQLRTADIGAVAV